MPKETQMQRQSQQINLQSQDQQNVQAQAQRQQQEQERIRQQQQENRNRQQENLLDQVAELQEQVPVETDTFEEMQTAYQNVHNRNMGCKHRMFRSTKDATKKRERLNELMRNKNGYEQLQNATARPFDLDKILQTPLTGDPQEDIGIKRRNANFRDQIRMSLDLSNTAEANAYNTDLVRRMSGDRQAQKEAAMDILQRFDAVSLEQFSALSDEQISQSYHQILYRINQADAAGGMLRHLMKDTEVDPAFVERIQAKVTFFKTLKDIVAAKVRLMKNPYYALLRKSDTESLSNDAIRRKLENNDFQITKIETDEQGNRTERESYDEHLADYYGAILALRQLSEKRAEIRDIAHFLANEQARQHEF